jgi:hypothetical protein
LRRPHYVPLLARKPFAAQRPTWGFMGAHRGHNLTTGLGARRVLGAVASGSGICRPEAPLSGRQGLQECGVSGGSCLASMTSAPTKAHRSMRWRQSRPLRARREASLQKTTNRSRATEVTSFWDPRSRDQAGAGIAAPATALAKTRSKLSNLENSLVATIGSDRLGGQRRGPNRSIWPGLAARMGAALTCARRYAHLPWSASRAKTTSILPI